MDRESLMSPHLVDGRPLSEDDVNRQKALIAAASDSCKSSSPLIWAKKGTAGSGFPARKEQALRLPQVGAGVNLRIL
jgi:hypothetical protein